MVYHAKLSAEISTELEREISTLGTLQELVKWGAAQLPPVLLAESIAQDEYTHDVIARWREGMVFVFGAT